MAKENNKPEGRHPASFPNNQQGTDKTKGNVEAAKKAYEEAKKKESK